MEDATTFTPNSAAVSDGAFSITSLAYDDSRYAEFLGQKLDVNLPLLEASVPKHLLSSPEVFTSPIKHYRHKCRFAVNRGRGSSQRLGYFLFDHGSASVPVEQYPIASRIINWAMPELLARLNDGCRLHIGIQAVTFLSTTHGDLSITLIYDTDISDASWEEEGRRLRAELWQRRSLPSTHEDSDETHLRELTIIGRSKGVRVQLGEEHVLEVLKLPDGRVLAYQQHVDGFSNPNPYVNMKCLMWLGEVFEAAGGNAGLQHLNLLEMFCGNGNHTVAICKYVKYAVLVELNPVLCASARVNLVLNGITNATVVPACHSQTFSRSILKTGAYKSAALICSFDIILVDPPRAGLDKDTRRMVAQYAYIVYISCSPKSLQRDLLEIANTHDVVRFAVFDQFAYTPHLECGVFLRKKVEALTQT